MMKLGIFSRTYGVSDLEETYKRMTAHGIYHTQFNLSGAGLETLPDNIDENRLKDILDMTKRYHITIDALSGTFNMIDPDKDARDRGCAQFEIQCRIAKMLHIPIVTLCTGSKHPLSKWKWHDDNKKQSSWNELLQTTDRILTYAEEQDVILGVEPEVSNVVNTPQKARDYLDQAGSTRLKIIMDGANLFLPDQVTSMHQVLEEAFELLGKDIILAHAKDFSLGDEIEFVAAGKGILDFPYYVELLKKYNYRGSLIMHGLSEEQVPDSSRFLRGIINNE